MRFPALHRGRRLSRALSRPGLFFSGFPLNNLRIRSIYLVSPVLFVALALLVGACSKGGDSASGGPPSPAGAGAADPASAGRAGRGTGGGRSGGRGGGGAAPVTVGVATQKAIPVDVQAIGNVEAYSTVSIKPLVSGQLMKVHIQEGAVVTAGTLLFTIDPAPYKAALDQAQANLARFAALVAQSEATLAKDMAQANYTRAEIDRYDNLLKRGIISKEIAEQYTSSADAADATVKADRATVASNRAQLDGGKAALETAKLQMGYTAIRSPMSGQTGNLPVKAGNIVTANVTELTTVTQVQPIYVTFSVPSVNLASIRKYQAEGSLQVLVTPQDQAGSGPVTGKLTFIDNGVDVTTDTIKLKATVANEEKLLWPGQFARVGLRLTTLPHALTVPADALQTGQDGQFVFVVTQDQTAELRPVRAGAHVGGDVVIESGLKPGEQVVTEGQVRLEPGMKVQVRQPQQDSGSGGRSGGRGTGRGGGRRGAGGPPSPGGAKAPDPASAGR